MTAATAAAAACGSPDLPDTIVADSAGIAIVTNVGSPPVLGWTLDTVRVFGGDESGPATFYQVRSPLVDVDSRGRIHLLEPGEYRVVVFDSTGAPVSSMGRRGEGPGELEWPLSVSAGDDGFTYVHDGGGRLVRLKPGDESGSESPLKYSVINMGLRHVEATPAGLLIWARARFTETTTVAELDARVVRLLSVRGKDTIPLLPGNPGHMTTAHYPRCNFTFSIHQPLAPRIRWSQWGDRVAVSAWGGFRIDVLEGHRMVRSVRWAGVGERQLTRVEAETLLQAEGFLGPCNDDVGETIDRHGFHPRPQVVSRLAVAPDGYVWAEVGRADVGSRVMLLAPEGRIEGVLADGFPMPLTFLPDDRAVIRVVDSLDFERVGIAEIKR